MKNTKPKQYNAAPLPFQGQKRNFLNHFKEAVESFDRATTFVDLFGGSGLLAHTVKRIRPDARVIYNDYDDYSRRLAFIPHTNKLLEKVRVITDHHPRGKMLSPEVKAEILAVVKQEEADRGFVDYISLSASILFSMKYVVDYEGLTKETLYNTVRKGDYDSTQYLDGLEVVHEDYRALFGQFRGDNGVVFLVDPPYLSTDAGTYQGYWKLADYLDVTLLLKDTNYVYFTSEKSHIVDLCNWIQNNQLTISPFAGAEQRDLQRVINWNSGYRDMMFFKKKP